MLNTEYLTRYIETLEKSCTCIKKAQEGSVDYEMFRNSLVKSFEITLEQSGKLLRKCLALNEIMKLFILINQINPSKIFLSF